MDTRYLWCCARAYTSHGSCMLLSAQAICRFGDIPISNKGDKEFADVVLIVTGPKKPRNIDVYIEPLIEDLMAYGPAGTF